MASVNGGTTMIKIAEALWSPEPSLLLKLCRQLGVDYAVGGLPLVDSRSGSDEMPWDYQP
jgi:hypothetical protein